VTVIMAILTGNRIAQSFGDKAALFTGGERKMTDTCRTCGRTESQAIADARAVGLHQEFQSGIYTCCQIAQWADEQWLAWFKATRADFNRVDDVTGGPELGEAEALLVPVRLRRPQVPWYRNPDDRS
jgi:hypothetical protein